VETAKTHAVQYYKLYKLNPTLYYTKHPLNNSHAL